MIYLLDSNTCIRYLNGRVPLVRQRMQTHRLEDVAVCSVVKAELFFGATRSNNPNRTFERQQQFLSRFTFLPFDDAAAVWYAAIRAGLSAAGTPIGPLDMQIAAIAMTHGLILVTHNADEFRRVANLRMEDWEI